VGLTPAVEARYRQAVTNPPNAPPLAEGKIQGEGGSGPAARADALAPEAVAEQDAASKDVAAIAGRGGLAVAFAKVYFIGQGLVQQIALPKVLGLDGYGAWSTVNSIASVTYNPVIQMSIQGVSRAVANAAPADQPAALRQTLSIHAVIAVVLGLGFYLLAPLITASAGAPHVTLGLQILSGAMFLYALYAPLIGALNGQRRFLAQAGFDVFAATLRTIGLVGGAYYLSQRAMGVEGAASGFVGGLVLLVGIALFVVGIGRPGRGISLGQHVAFIAPVLLGQVLLNMLLQADLTLLRRFASDAAVAAGQPLTAADPLVGAYRATQLFSFLPYQLLISVNFVLFPMLATAVRDDDKVAIRVYVATGVRIALLVAGLMVSVTAGLSAQLIELVFGREAAALGGRSLTLLALGFGAFAIFGVLTTVLNSLKRERASAGVTGLGVIAVIVTCFAWVRGAAFGEELLFRTASATSTGLLIAAIGAAVVVYRTAGSVIAPISALRVLAAVALTVGAGRFAPSHGKLATIACSGGLALLYVVLLVGTRELGRKDLAIVARVARRRTAPKPS
jgi:stage V sporulation protein B